MKVLDRYLWSATLQGVVIAWIALVILDLFFSFINEAGKTNALYTTNQAIVYLIYTLPGRFYEFFAFINEAGKTNALYTTTQAIVYLIYTLPGRFYEFFPTSVLIGTLLGLGNLAANSEFIAMRAAGISIQNIIFSILKLGLILALLIFGMGEWIVPESDLHARNFKAHLKNKNIVLVGGTGLWVKDKNSVIKIGKVINKQHISDISVYTFKEDHSGLESLTTIKNAKANKSDWKLQKVTTTTFEKKRAHKVSEEFVQSKGFISQNILDVASVDPNQLSSSALTKIIDYQKKNFLKTDKYELIYWKRFSIPLSALVMLILAMPFLFSSNRGGGAGQRVFIGIVIGIMFYLANRTANEIGIVYGVSPLLSAFLPSLLVLGIGLFSINRIR